MRRVHLLAAWVFLAAAALAGCQQTEWNWWRPPARDPAPAPAPTAGAPRTPEDPSGLRAENEVLRGQLAELKARDARLAEKVAELQFLCDQQDKTIQTLKEAPDERDKARREAAELKARFDLLRGEVEFLRSGAGAPARQPAPPTTAPAPAAPGPG